MVINEQILTDSKMVIESKEYSKKIMGEDVKNL